MSDCNILKWEIAKLIQIGIKYDLEIKLYPSSVHTYSQNIMDVDVGIEFLGINGSVYRRTYIDLFNADDIREVNSEVLKAIHYLEFKKISEGE